MKKIEIKIADNLTPQAEILAIAKQLATKQLSVSGRNKEVKRIGNELSITDLQTQITVTRVSKEKPIEMVTCNVCNCEYADNTAKYYYHNYGGSNTRRAVCSEGCRNFMIENFGVRVAKSARKLPRIVFRENVFKGTIKGLTEYLNRSNDYENNSNASTRL